MYLNTFKSYRSTLASREIGEQKILAKTPGKFCVEYVEPGRNYSAGQPTREKEQGRGNEMQQRLLYTNQVLREED